MSSTEALRRWLRQHADSFFERSLADAAAIQYARVAADYLLDPAKVEQVIAVVEGADTGAVKFTIGAGWDVTVVAKCWERLLVSAVLSAPPPGLKKKSPSLNRSRIRKWIADHGELADRLRKAPSIVFVPRQPALHALMARLCHWIDYTTRHLLNKAPNILAGHLLPGDHGDWQNQLLRLLRAHAALSLPRADREWREEALVDIASGHGYGVEVYSDQPTPQPILRGEARVFAPDVTDLQRIPATPAVPAIEHINRLIDGVHAKDSRLHEWFSAASPIAVRELPPEVADLSPEDYVPTERGFLVKRKHLVALRRREMYSRHDLFAIATLSIPQLESLIHQAAHHNGATIPLGPKPLVSLRRLENTEFSPSIRAELLRFFREGTDSPRYRFAHGATESLFHPEIARTTIDVARLLSSTLPELERCGWLPTNDSDWWHSTRGLTKTERTFVLDRTKHMNLNSGNELVDHILDIHQISKFLAPEDVHLWSLAIARGLSDHRDLTADWAWAHIVFPLAEALLRNLWQSFGYGVVKITAAAQRFRYSPALLNSTDLLTDEILGRFYSPATKTGPDLQLVALLQRVRNALLHGEGHTLGISPAHCLKLAIYAVGAITFRCGLIDG